MKSIIGLAVLLAAIFSVVDARNPSDLKSDLASIMPAGKKARLAWIKGGSFSEFCFYANSTAVYVTESDDGAIRRLHPATGTGTFYHVNISADGSRVFFANGASGRLCVINWDGSGFKEVNVGGTAIEYWRNPADNSDWAIVAASSGGTMSRVNIDQPAQRANIGAQATAGNGGGGLSDDGTMLVGYRYQGTTGFGIIPTATLQWQMGPHGGCWCWMSAGAQPRYNHNPSGHSQMCVHDAVDQTKFTVYPVSTKFQEFLAATKLQGDCYKYATNEGTRFSQHPDFATFMSGKSTVNPVLMRLSDMKFVYIEDNLPCTYCGDMDAVFLPYNGVPTPVLTARKSMTAEAGLRSVEESFLPDGRRWTAEDLSSKSSRFSQGIVIKRAGRGANGLQMLLVH